MDIKQKEFTIKALNKINETYQCGWDVDVLKKFSDDILSAIYSHIEKYKSKIDYAGLIAFINHAIKFPNEPVTNDTFNNFLITHFSTNFNGIYINHIKNKNSIKKFITIPSDFNYSVFYHFLLKAELINKSKEHPIKYELDNLLNALDRFLISNYSSNTPENITLTLSSRLYLFLFFNKNGSSINLFDLATDWDELKLRLLSDAATQYESSAMPNAYELFFGNDGLFNKIAEYCEISLDESDTSSTNNFILYRSKLINELKTKNISQDHIVIIDGFIREITEQIISKFLTSPTTNSWDLFEEAVHAGVILKLEEFIKLLPSPELIKTFNNILKLIDISDLEKHFGKFNLNVAKCHTIYKTLAAENHKLKNVMMFDTIPVAPTNTDPIAPASAQATSSTTTANPSLSKQEELSPVQLNFFQRHKRALIGFGIGLGIAVGIGLLVAATLFTLGAVHIITAPTLFALLVTVGVPTTLKFLTIPAVTTGTAEIIAASTVAGSTASITTGLGVTGAAIGHGLDKKRKREEAEEDKAKVKRTQAAQQPPASGDNSAQSSQEYPPPSAPSASK